LETNLVKRPTANATSGLVLVENVI
jgi:hypothetical protein